MQFEWDNIKNDKNIKKHGVSFNEAKSVFFDEYAIFEMDEEHSDYEDRFLLLGLSEIGNTLIVSHCERSIENGNESIRIISARKATKNESLTYWRKRIS